MMPEDRKNVAEAWLAYAKIFALVIVAGWTWWQWDKTIFPKEQWDQSVRASSARVDLRLDSTNFRIGKLVHKEVAKINLLKAENEARLKQGVPTLIKFDVPLHNDRPFPVQLKVKKILLRQAIVPKSGASVEWSEPETLAVSNLFNIERDAAWIVETGSKVILSGQHVTAIKWCCAAAGTKPRKPASLWYYEAGFGSNWQATVDIRP